MTVDHTSMPLGSDLVAIVQLADSLLTAYRITSRRQLLCSRTYLLTVCLPSPQHMIIFWNWFWPLTDGKNKPLCVTIPMRHRLSSADQNWQGYWSLTWPKILSSHLNFSHFCKDWFFSRQHLTFFLHPSTSFLDETFFKPVHIIVAPALGKKVRSSWVWEKDLPNFWMPISPYKSFFCTLCWEFNPFGLRRTNEYRALYIKAILWHRQLLNQI